MKYYGYDTLDYIILGFGLTAKFLVIIITLPFWLPFYLIGRFAQWLKSESEDE